MLKNELKTTKTFNPYRVGLWSQNISPPNCIRSYSHSTFSGFTTNKNQMLTKQKKNQNPEVVQKTINHKQTNPLTYFNFGCTKLITLVLASLKACCNKSFTESKLLRGLVNISRHSLLTCGK
jgi:hypothetical protein